MTPEDLKVLKVLLECAENIVWSMREELEQAIKQLEEIEKDGSTTRKSVLEEES